MNKLTITVSALAVLSLLGLGTGFAQPEYYNEVGLYTNSDGSGATGTYVVGSPVIVYLVLTNPADDQNDYEPFTHLGFFDCTITFQPVPDNNLLVLATILPPQSLDIGRYKDINQGVLEFIVGLGTPAPVTNGAAILIEFTFLSLSIEQIEVTLSPIPDVPGIPGEMSYLAGLPPYENDDIRVMHPVSGSHDAPVFIFNGEAVPVEREAFGSVKALYR